MKKPNIFDYATSELSQDAFISWLISWACPEYKKNHEPLHKTAIQLIDTFFQKCGKTKPDKYRVIKVSQQFMKIDVLVKINDQYAIIIEDKVSTENSVGQLETYLKKVQGMKDFSDENILPIYFKTGNQSDYKKVIACNYSIFSRQDFLEILKFGETQGIDNPIFNDYFEYLKKIDDDVNSYKILPVEKWSGNAWEGFFMKLQETIDSGKWGYVHNYSGGFVGFWWHTKIINNCSVYLQLEEDKFCFKLFNVENKEKRTVYRNKWYSKLLREGPNHGLDITKPPRFGFGKTMTFGQLKNGYLQRGNTGVPEIKNTVAVLRKAEKLLDVIISS